MAGWIKLCGVTTLEDAQKCARAGADAVGINLWPTSPRYVGVAQAVALARAIEAEGAQAVVVTVDPDDALLSRIAEEISPRWIQFHGDESPQRVASVEGGIKALGVADAEDASRAQAYGGDWILVDAQDATLKGGTGQLAPWDLVKPLAVQRRVVLAGGLTPDNVKDAITSVHPYGVDVASGIEATVGTKSADKIEKFIERAREAFATLD